MNVHSNNVINTYNSTRDATTYVHVHMVHIRSSCNIYIVVILNGIILFLIWIVFLIRTYVRIYTPLRQVSLHQQLTGVHNVTGVKLSDGLLYPGMA